MSSGYFLKLEQFEGPLDLLLHLIKVNEIDVFNIDIFLLTNQYLEYLRLIKFDDLKDAGEFLAMAATLIEIKSRMLLPIEDTGKAADSGDEEDPMKTLQQRLIEYEKIRKVADYFYGIPQVGVQIQSNHEWQRLEPFYEHVEAPLEGDPASLVILYEQLLNTLPERKAVKVEARTHMVSVEEKIDELQSLLERLNFALFQGFYKNFKSRYELVVYILAVLEMVRFRRLKVYQGDLKGPMWIYRMDLNERELPLTRDEKQRLVENAVIPTPVAEGSVEQQ